MNILALAANPHLSGAWVFFGQRLRPDPRCLSLDIEYRSAGEDLSHHDYAIDLVRRHLPDVLVIAVYEYWYPIGKNSHDVNASTVSLVEAVRKQFPKTCIILCFPDAQSHRALLNQFRNRFDHYLTLFYKATKADITNLFMRAGRWKSAQYKYDVALSFAGSERAPAEELARLLTAAGVRVFYDYDEQADLWGRNLYQHFQHVYRDQALYFVPFLSSSYGSRAWPNHELAQAQARAFTSNVPYILPIRVDGTAIPGVNEITGAVDLKQSGVAGVADLLLQKLFGKSREHYGPA